MNSLDGHSPNSLVAAAVSMHARGGALAGARLAALCGMLDALEALGPLPGSAADAAMMPAVAAFRAAAHAARERPVGEQDAAARLALESYCAAMEAALADPAALRELERAGLTRDGAAAAIRNVRLPRE